MKKFFNLAQHCLFNQTYKQAPSRKAFSIVNSNLDIQSLSYAALQEKSKIFCDKLLQLSPSTKPKTPDRVLILLDNQIEFAEIFLGTILAGKIATCISTLSSQDELLFFIKDSDPQFIVTNDTYSQRFQKVFSKHYKNKVFLCGSSPLVNNNHYYYNNKLNIESFTSLPLTTKESPAYITYTSGTTGYPKGVVHAHRSILGRQPASNYWFNFSHHKQNNIFHSGKLNWTYTLGTGFMDLLYRGHHSILFQGKLDVKSWQIILNKFQVHIFISVPTFYRQILKYSSSLTTKFNDLSQCLSAGEHLPNIILTEFEKRFQQKIYEGLGMSEVSYYISNHPSFKIKPGSAGKIQTGHHIEILNPINKKCQPFEEGMIHIMANDAGLALGYWTNRKIKSFFENKSACSKERNKTNIKRFATGDFAYIDDENYVWFLGRKDDIIASFGYRISPLEIERVAKELPQIENCAAIGETIEEAKTIVALVVEVNTTIAPTSATILRHLERHLAQYKVPKKIYFTDELPKSQNGKILRNKIILTP